MQPLVYHARLLLKTIFLSESTLNIQTPGIPTYITGFVNIYNTSDPGIVTKISPSPELIPTKASVLTNPGVPS